MDAGPDVGTARDWRRAAAGGHRAPLRRRGRRAGAVRTRRPARVGAGLEAATRWIAERVAIERLVELTDDQAYRAMDFLLDALDEIASQVFNSVAHLLNLDLDIVFVDTTSTYWETETADELAELAEDPGDDEVSSPTEAGARAFGHFKDIRQGTFRTRAGWARTRRTRPHLALPARASVRGMRRRTHRPGRCHRRPGRARRGVPDAVPAVRRSGVVPPVSVGT